MKPSFDVTFGVGPTRISEDVYHDMRRAAALRVCELSHRSSAFSDISAETAAEVRKFLSIPNDYKLIWLTCASEAWQILSLNVVENYSYHLVNGNFSSSAAKTAELCAKKTLVNEVPWGHRHDCRMADIPLEAELITLAYNETSAGVQWDTNDLRILSESREIEKDGLGNLLAVDITSCAGVTTFDIPQADIWYASVQKGFGLPSGFGFMALSPRVLEKARVLKEKGLPVGYFNLPDMVIRMEEHAFTLQTPNILDIFLLREQLTRWNRLGGASVIEGKIRARAKRLYDFFEAHKEFSPFVTEPLWRSHCALNIAGDVACVAAAHAKAKELNMELGKGYGKLKSTCLRIANYPALEDKHFDTLMGEVLKV